MRTITSSVDSKIAGALVYRFAPGDLAELVDISVEAWCRRQGVGRQLVNQFLKESKVQKVWQVYAVTRSSNIIAQEFYEEMGFHVIGNLRNFYADVGGVDAVMYGRKVI